MFLLPLSQIGTVYNSSTAICHTLQSVRAYMQIFTADEHSLQDKLWFAPKSETWLLATTSRHTKRLIPQCTQGLHKQQCSQKVQLPLTPHRQISVPYCTISTDKCQKKRWLPASMRSPLLTNSKSQTQLEGNFTTTTMQCFWTMMDDCLPETRLAKQCSFTKWMAT